jgi:hypothetical protein
MVMRTIRTTALTLYGVDMTTLTQQVRAPIVAKMVWQAVQLSRLIEKGVRVPGREVVVGEWLEKPMEAYMWWREKRAEAGGM